MSERAVVQTPQAQDDGHQDGNGLSRALTVALGRAVDEVQARRSAQNALQTDQNVDPEQELKDELAARIAERYGVILPFAIRKGATSNQIRDIRGLLHDAQCRFNEQQEGRSHTIPLPGRPSRTEAGVSWVTSHAPRVPLA